MQIEKDSLVADLTTIEGLLSEMKGRVDAKLNWNYGLSLVYVCSLSPAMMSIAKLLCAFSGIALPIAVSVVNGPAGLAILSFPSGLYFLYTSIKVGVIQYCRLCAGYVREKAEIEKLEDRNQSFLQGFHFKLLSWMTYAYR